jgi:farnesyl-diphosphate farnesyltransferase
LDLHRKPLDFGPLAEKQGLPAEGNLLRRIEEALALIPSFSPYDQAQIRQVLETITSGQELDLQRFGHSNASDISLLGTDPELEDYTYRVAGCVGEFWTKLCRAHVFPTARLDEAVLFANGVRFGKGLQLVNILRDLPNDLRQGRCYLPSDHLRAAGLKAKDLLDVEQEPRLRPVYNRYLDLAMEHLSAGWDYTNMLPTACVRVRLACAWPVLIGARTIALLRTRAILNPSQRVKVSRTEVRSLLIRSVLLYPFPKLWQRLLATAERG